MDLSTAASVANQKLIGYKEIQSDLAIFATVLDPPLNISFKKYLNEQKHKIQHK
jgi:hypothetical protein